MSKNGAIFYSVSPISFARRQAGRDAYIPMMGSRVRFGLLHHPQYTMEPGRTIERKPRNIRYPQSRISPSTVRRVERRGVRCDVPCVFSSSSHLAHLIQPTAPPLTPSLTPSSDFVRLVVSARSTASRAARMAIY